MRILVTGANGYIGLATADALRRNGHIVYGLIRNESHKNELIKREIIPLIGDFKDPKSWLSVLDEVGVVIDTVSPQGGDDPFAANRSLFAATAQAAKRLGLRKRFIFTSGCMDYGNQPGKVSYESSKPLGFPKRIEFINEILRNIEIDCAVVRPGFVYGGTGGTHIASWYAANEKGVIDYYGDPNKSWPWVHVTDLAQAFVVLVESPRGSVSGEIFNVSDDTRITCLQAREAMARAGDAKDAKVELHPASDDPLSQRIEVTHTLSCEKLRNIGWVPRCGPFLDNIKLYAHAAIANGTVHQKVDHH